MFVQSIGGNFGDEEPVQQAAPPLDSELQFNPVANSSPANQNQNQFKIQKKRGMCQLKGPLQSVRDYVLFIHYFE